MKRMTATRVVAQWPLSRSSAALVSALGVTAITLAGAGAVIASEAVSPSADPGLSQRVQAIAIELRCLVCQNQTIADSHADLAVDLRNQVRDMLRQGKSEREIIDYMTARYGDFVLYRPPVKGSTALLWFGPAALLAGGILALSLVLRRRCRMGAEAFESEESFDLDSVAAAAADSNVAAGKVPS